MFDDNWSSNEFALEMYLHLAWQHRVAWALSSDCKMSKHPMAQFDYEDYEN